MIREMSTQFAREADDLYANERDEVLRLWRSQIDAYSIVEPTVLSKFGAKDKYHFTVDLQSDANENSTQASLRSVLGNVIASGQYGRDLHAYFTCKQGILHYQSH